MLVYEILGIALGAVLVAAAIGGLAARVMMGPEEKALLRFAQAVEAQRQLVASAAQKKRNARVAEAQRRLVASASGQQDDWIWRYLKRQYEAALAAPLSPRLATLITQLETQHVNA
jgi:hypothetical protein